MKVAYNTHADALYIRMLEDEYHWRIVRLTDDIVPRVMPALYAHNWGRNWGRCCLR